MGAFDGNGTFVRSYSWAQDAANNINITASRVDTEDNGYAAGLTLAVTRDGQGKMTTDFLPNTDNTLNLGTAIKRWASLNGTPTAILTALAGAAGPYIQNAYEAANSIVPTNLAYPPGHALRYGADPSGVVDCTALLQIAANVAGNGTGLMLLPAGTFMINQVVKLWSNTILQGAGAATIIKANPTYIGINGGSYAAQTSHMIGNVNFAAVALTDHDIVVRDVSFDWGTVTVAGGGAHSVSFHFVDRVTVFNVNSNKGENVTSFISCRDTSTLFCHGTNCSNAYFDDWGGTSSAHVISCTGRTTSGTTAQGIQFTGQGSFGDSGTAQNAVVAFCELYGVKSAGTASALICNANGAASSTARFKTFGNYVENCDLGWVVQGAIGQAQSHGDTFRSCTTGAPIFFNTDASGAPSNCKVVNPTLIDCSHTGGNIGMIVITGTNNRVEGVNVFSPGGTLYTQIAWFPVGAVNCFLSIDKAPSGITNQRVNNQSATSLVKDTDDLDAWPYPGALATIASANTIAPTWGTTFVSGGTTVKTITPPPGIFAGGTITLISSGNWITDTTGNIQIASTPVTSRPIQFTYIPSLGKWYPSYT